MSNNTTLNIGQGGDVIRTVDTDGVKTQAVVLMGTQDSGDLAYIPVTTEGHIEAAIHSPRLPFGSVHAESIKPIIQGDGVYGVNSTLLTATTGLAVGTGANSASTGSTGNKLFCQTGTTQYSFASLQSRRRVKYRPGQGIIGRFAGHFSTPAANSILVVGFGTGESSLCFGYNGTQFGILQSTGGVREVHTFTVTTASTATNNYVVTLPNGATVSVAATNNGSTVKTAYEIAQGVYPGWAASQRGSTVIFLADSVGNKSGSFSLAQTGAATPAAGSDAETVAGVAATDTWTYQANWNLDPLDGTGASGFTIDPSKGNVYQIGLQYLGFGAIVFSVEVTFPGANNPEIVPVHVIKYPNTATSTSLSQPNFPFLMAAYSAGSTTNVGVFISSYMAGVEGQEVNIGPRMSYQNVAAVTSSTSAYTPLFTVRNALVFGGRANQTVVKLFGVTGAAKSTNALTTFYLIRDAVLSAGTPNFSQFSTKSSTDWDTAATACTFSDNAQIIWSGAISEAGDFVANFTDHEITLQPGETLTLAVRSVTATATCVGSLNTREDQ